MSDASKYDLLKHFRLSADISVQTLADLYALQTFRRKWGVSVYVYEDGANTGTYRLVKGHNSDNPQDNLNWVKDTGGGGYEPKNSIEVDTGGLQLVGDELAPGNNKVYGTDAAGEKGWKDDPAGGTPYTPPPKYGEIVNYDEYEDGRVKRIKTDFGDSKYIETRVAYHESGDAIGKVDFKELKDDLTDQWIRIEYTYDGSALAAPSTITDILDWTISV